MISAALVLLALLDARPSLEADRANILSRDIAAEVDTLDEARAVIATIETESGMRESVQSCRVTGDHGKAISMGQIHRFWWEGHSRREICADNRLAMRLTIGALRALGGKWGRWDGAFYLYVGRGAARNDPRIVRRQRLFARLQRLAAKREKEGET